MDIVSEQMKRKDFFISYNQTDRTWAIWIARQLESEGYTTALQAEDFSPGGNFMLELDQVMSRSKRMIVVLSPAYFTSRFVRLEWAAVLARDPTGEKHLLLPVRVRRCNPEGLLASITYVDLVGLKEIEAREALLSGVHHADSVQRLFPSWVRGDVQHEQLLTTIPAFPGLTQPSERDWLITYEFLKELPESQFNEILNRLDSDGHCDLQTLAADDALERSDLAVRLLDRITQRGRQWWIQLQEVILLVRSPFSPLTSSLSGWVGRPMFSWQVDREQLLGLGNDPFIFSDVPENTLETCSVLTWEGLKFRDGRVRARIWLPTLHERGAAGLVLRYVEKQSALLGLLHYVSPDSGAIELLQMGATGLTVLNAAAFPTSIEDDGWYALSLQLDQRCVTLSVSSYTSVSATLSTDLPAGYVGVSKFADTLVRFDDIRLEVATRDGNS